MRNETAGPDRPSQSPGRLRAAAILSLASGLLALTGLYAVVLRLSSGWQRPEPGLLDVLLLALPLLAAGLAFLLALQVRRHGRDAGLGPWARITAVAGEWLGVLTPTIFLLGSLGLSVVAILPEPYLEEAWKETLADLGLVRDPTGGEPRARTAVSPAPDRSEARVPVGPPPSPDGPERVRRLVRDLRAGDAEQRRRAMDALAGLGPERVADVSLLPPAIPALIDALGEDDQPWGALRALSRAGPASVPALFEALENGDFEVNHTFIRLVDELGPAAGPLAPGLASRLVHVDDRSARDIQVGLELLGEAAVGPLIGLLGRPDARSRERAAEAIGRIGPQAKAAAPALATLLDDESEEVRRSAQNALALIGQGAVPPSATAAIAASPERRASALRALGKSEVLAPEGRRMLLEALEDPVTEVRAVAALSLSYHVSRGTIRSDDARDVATALEERLREDPSAMVRAQAASALGHFGGGHLPASMRNLPPKRGSTPAGEIAPVLVEALREDLDPGVRRSAALALRSIEADYETVRAVLEESLADPSLVRFVASVIESYGPVASASTPALFAAVARGPARGCSEIGRALRAVGAEIEPLLALVQADDIESRQCALRALLPLDEVHTSPEALEALGEAFTQPEPEIRRLAASVLAAGRGPSKAASSALLKGIEDPDPHVRASVIRALGRRGAGDPRVLKVLLDHLEDEHPSARDAAARALAGFGEDAAAAVPRLLELLDEERLSARAGYSALGSIGDPRAIPLLVEVLGSSGQDLRVPAARSTLHRLAPEHPRAVLEELARPGLSELPRHILRSSLSGVRPEGIPLLREALEDERPRVREEAARALGHLARRSAKHRAEILQDLKPLLDDPDRQVRAAAGQALRLGDGVLD